jgi:hypothetical protein
MFHWLFEGRLSVYLLLATVALVLLAVWWSTRKRKYAIAAAAVAVLAGLYGLLDLAVETDHEQMERKIREMAGSAKNKDANRLFEHIAADFNYNGRTKTDLIALAKNAIGNGGVSEIVVWEFERGEVSRDDRSGTIVFLIKMKGPWTRTEIFLRCKAQFLLDTDRQWRLRRIELFDPINNERVDY